jgi:hypothetical protein
MKLPQSLANLRLVKGLVTANSLAAVEVAVHTRVDLVQEVGLVRTGGVRGRAGGVRASNASVVGGVGAGGEAGATGGAGVAVTAAVEVGVDTGVGSVGDAAAVRTGSALGDVAAGGAMGAMGGSSQARSASGAVGGTSQARGASGTVSATVAAAVEIRVDTGVGSVGDAAAVRAGSALGDVAAGGTVSTVGGTSQARGAMSAVGGTSQARRAMSAVGGTSQARGASGAVAAAVKVRVDARVGSIGNTTAVRSNSAFGDVARGVSGARGASVADTSVGGGAMSAGRGVGANGAAVVAVRVDARVQLVGYVGAVRASSGLSRPVGVVGASGASGVSGVAVGTTDDAGSTVVAVRVDTRISGVGSTAAVRSVGTLRLRGLVAVGARDGFLDLVEEVRHDEGVSCLWFWVELSICLMCKVFGYIVNVVMSDDGKRKVLGVEM